MSPLVLLALILMTPAAIAIGILLWAGASLTLDAWHCRHPHPTSIGEEAERWLRRQQGAAPG